MSVEQDIERIRRQEERLQFAAFDIATAWELGNRLRAAAVARNAPVAIDVQMHGHPLFFSALPGSTPENIDWIRRKRNVVQLFRRSSYLIGLELQVQQTSLAARLGVDPRDYAAGGGGFPVIVRGTGCVGFIGVSGLPQREDHEMIVAVLCDLLGVPYAEVALGEG